MSIRPQDLVPPALIAVQDQARARRKDSIAAARDEAARIRAFWHGVEKLPERVSMMALARFLGFDLLAGGDDEDEDEGEPGVMSGGTV